MKKAITVATRALCCLFLFYCPGYGKAATPSKFAGEWVIGTKAIPGKPEKMELFKKGAGRIDGDMEISWMADKKQFIISSAALNMSCNYRLSGYELAFVYYDGDSATFVKKGKMEAFRAKQAAAAEAEFARRVAVLAKPYVAPAKKHKRQIEQILSQYFVPVRGGTFQMGCTAEQGGDDDCDKDEKPVHSVTVSDFHIGRYEATQKLWTYVMDYNPSVFKGDDLPAECVSWDDVQIFMAALSAVAGKKYRLPTEAEWEYAARGGNKSKGYRYAGSDDIKAVAWYGGNSGAKTHPVGGKQPNELGIYDMSGNVWEWMRDGYGRYGAEAQVNPVGAESGLTRVIRGGSWHYKANLCRSANRDIITQDYRFNNLGFRIVHSP